MMQFTAIITAFYRWFAEDFSIEIKPETQHDCVVVITRISDSELSKRGLRALWNFLCNSSLNTLMFSMSGAAQIRVPYNSLIAKMRSLSEEDIQCLLYDAGHNASILSRGAFATDHNPEQS